MNIDRQKFKEAIERGDTAHKSSMQILDDCEVKRKCFDCEVVQSVDCAECHNCFSNPNLADNSRPKRNEMDNLFIGAPVMVRDVSFGEDEDFTLKISGKDKFVTNDVDCLELRLPTFEEAPRNVWLAPWLEAPNGLEELVCWCRIKDDDDLYNLQGVLWCEVEAIMILEDFKKKVNTDSYNNT